MHSSSSSSLAFCDTPSSTSARGVGDRGGPRGRFDGDGMVHAVRIKKGKAAYANSWVKTARLKQELRAGRALFPKARLACCLSTVLLAEVMSAACRCPLAWCPGKLFASRRGLSSAPCAWAASSSLCELARPSAYTARHHTFAALMCRILQSQCEIQVVAKRALHIACCPLRNARELFAITRLHARDCQGCFASICK